MIKGFALLVGLGLISGPTPSHAVPFQLHARTWTDAGRVMKSTDTLQINYNGNWQQTMGMQVNGTADLAEHLEGGFGFGLTQVYHSLGSTDQEKFTLSKFINYVAEARLTYTLGEKPNPLFYADLGDFAFNYAPHVKNLGLYLFRGPVYPGFLVSGFKEFHTDTTRAGFLGLHLHNGLGNFQHDVLISSERDLPPSFDWSLGYVARYKAFNALEIGAGVNFYHLIAENADITSPNRGTVKGLLNKDSSLMADGTPFHPYNLQYMEVVAPGDTVMYTHRGTKVMGMFNFDIKRLLGLDGPLGEKDLLLYGEGAIIGTRNYGTVYGKRSERMPVMVGFNLPVFGVLDFLSIEVEHYTAKYKADYSKLGYDRSLYFKNIFAPQLLAQKSPSAIPISLKDLAGEKYTITPEGDFVNNQSGDTIQVRGTALDAENLTADDWKWSLNFEKTLVRHVQFSGQLANDHFVPRPVRSGLINENGGLSQIFSSTKDWYFMFRVGYFF
ncbi:MAG: hypothetical protein JWP91_2422 [Fibrobacteres bacterium]|nr:hypothetical protein [Fibrobacterota bacterium]